MPVVVEKVAVFTTCTAIPAALWICNHHPLILYPYSLHVQQCLHKPSIY